MSFSAPPDQSKEATRFPSLMHATDLLSTQGADGGCAVCPAAISSADSLDAMGGRHGFRLLQSPGCVVPSKFGEPPLPSMMMGNPRDPPPDRELLLLDRWDRVL